MQRQIILLNFITTTFDVNSRKSIGFRSRTVSLMVKTITRTEIYVRSLLLGELKNGWRANKKPGKRRKEKFNELMHCLRDKIRARWCKKMWPFKTNFESHNKNKTLFYDASNDGAMKAARLNHEITFFFNSTAEFKTRRRKKSSHVIPVHLVAKKIYDNTEKKRFQLGRLM